MKLDIFTKNNQLDEMQEQTLRKIEGRGFWVMFVGLLAALLIQLIMGARPVQLAGEWVVFMAGCVYVGVGCMRQGIWDRHLKANLVTNTLLSLAAALIMGVINYIQFGFWEAAAFTGAFTCLLCLAALQLASYLTGKRRKKLEEVDE